MTTEILLQTLASGVLIGLIYALVAIGLTMIFGVMDIVNFAHGEFLMLGMYSTFWLFSLYALDPMITLPLTVIMLFAFGMLLYKLVPHRRVHWRHAIVGAVTASVLFEGAKALFAIYVRNVPGYNVLYGAFVSLPFFLLWIYVSWLVVLFGAELTAALGNWKPRTPAPPMEGKDS